MNKKMSFSNGSSSISFTLNKVRTVEFGGIDLRPEYQRGLVWKNDFKDKLLYSIIKGYPIGNISIRTLSDGQVNLKGASQEVVDGQQRLSAILAFRDNAYTIKSEWSKNIIKEIKYYFDSANKTDRKLEKLIKRATNKGNISLKFDDLPEIIQGNFENYDLAISNISYASDSQIREYFRFLQNQERLRAGEIINSMPPSNLEGYIKQVIYKEQVLDIIGFSDDRKEFDKVFYSIIGLVDGKINFGTTDKIIQNYASDAEELTLGKPKVERMIEQLNSIVQCGETAIDTTRKRYLKFMLLLMSLGYVDFSVDTVAKLEELAEIDNSLSVFFSAKSGVLETQFSGYSEEVIEELRLIGLLSKSGHSLSRVENRMKILAYYVNNPNEKTKPSGVKLIEETQE